MCRLIIPCGNWLMNTPDANDGTLVRREKRVKPHPLHIAFNWLYPTVVVALCLVVIDRHFQMHFGDLIGLELQRLSNGVSAHLRALLP